MPKNNPNRIIGAIAALAIFVTAIGAGSAQAADRSNANGALAALLGLVVIGAIIHEKNEDDRRERRRAEAAAKQKSQAHKARPLPPRVRRALQLPQSCVRDVFDRNGNRARILGQRCMVRNYNHVQSLPQACERIVRTDRGIRRGWSARCLRRDGYQIAAY